MTSHPVSSAPPRAPHPVPRAPAGALRRKIQEFGGGPYGVGALGWFGVLEGLEIYEIWLRGDGVRALIRALRSDPLAFWLDSLMNGVMAMMWPLEVLGSFGVVGIVVVGLLLSVDAFRDPDDGTDEQTPECP